MKLLIILANFLLIAIPSALIGLFTIYFLSGFDIPMDVSEWNMDQRASLLLVFALSWFFIFAGIDINKQTNKKN